MVDNQGTLYLVGTPIGNLEDGSQRALRILRDTEIVLCEDTRRTSKLVPGRHLESYFEGNEKRKTPQVIEWLKQGKNVALVSDSGMPLISDPGFVLVRECIKEGIKIEVVPGPSALTAAVAISGLPVDQVLFLGFLPKKAGKRKKLLATLKGSTLKGLNPTIVIYESPYRLKQTLAEIKEILGDVQVALCGELTKMHEKVIRGKITEISLPEKIKGEWVIVLSLRD